MNMDASRPVAPGVRSTVRLGRWRVIGALTSACDVLNARSRRGAKGRTLALVLRSVQQLPEQ